MGPLGIGGIGLWISYWPIDSTSGGQGGNMAHVPESHNSPTALGSNNYCVCLNVFVSQGRTHCAQAQQTFLQVMSSARCGYQELED